MGQKLNAALQRCLIAPLSCVVAFSVLSAPAELAALREARHEQLSVATLVPVTEASIWQSRCKPASPEEVNDVLRAIYSASAQELHIFQFEPLHVRAAIYDPPRMIYVDAALSVKVVHADRVSYHSVDPASKFGNVIRRVFDNCR